MLPRLRPALARHARAFATAPAPPAGAALALFSYQICPFCHKAKAVLRARGLPFQTVEVNPLTKAQIGWSKAWRKVPIAVFADGEVVHDSSAIVDAILARAPPDDDGARAAFASADARRWSAWATDELALYMYPNMTRTFAESRAALAYASSARGFSGLDAFLVQTVGALGMSFAHSKIKQKYGIDDERAALWARVDAWTAALDEGAAARAGGGGPFRARGAAPDLGDVAVYGVLQAAAGLELYDEIAARGGARAAEWLGAMEAALPPPVHVE